MNAGVSYRGGTIDQIIEESSRDVSQKKALQYIDRG